LFVSESNCGLHGASAREEIMNYLAPLGPVYQAELYQGNLLAVRRMFHAANAKQ
jgi:glutamate-1-semialdehyde aminotransferase